MEDLKQAIAHALETAKLVAGDAGRSETGRYIALAITALETALAITALETAENWVRRAEGTPTPRNDGYYPSSAQMDEAIERGKRLQSGESPE